MNAEELKRYSRQIKLPEVGEHGQERLKQASVLVVGAGGLGCPVTLYLAGAGVGRIGIVDNDTVNISNLHRQVLFDTAAQGTAKVDAVGQRLTALQPGVTVDRHNVRLSAENAMDIIKPYDIVVDGTDNFATRYLVNDACVFLKKPNVYGSVLRFEGQNSLFCTADGPCYRCMYPEPPAPGDVPSCAEGGVLGVLPGMIGMIQATETIKLILGISDTLAGRLLFLDAISMRWWEVRLKKNPDCPVCGAHPTIRKLEDTAASCRASAAPGEGASPELREISARELREMLDAEQDNMLLLDVREPYEHKIAAIKGARLIPLGELTRRLDEISDFRQSPVVVHCHHGVRSARAIDLLRTKGFENLMNLKDGIDAWSRDVDADVARY